MVFVNTFKICSLKSIIVTIANQNVGYLGMLHAGIGPSHVNALLTSVNIPSVSQSTFKSRELEVGPVNAEVAKASCEKAMEGENEYLKKEGLPMIWVGRSVAKGIIV